MILRVRAERFLELDLDVLSGTVSSMDNESLAYWHVIALR